MVSAQECRDNAARCVEFGNEAATVEEQNRLFEMARRWIEIAERLEQRGDLAAQLQHVSLQLN